MPARPAIDAVWHGHRLNRHRLPLDPHARNIVCSLRWHDALFGPAGPCELSGRGLALNRLLPRKTP